MTRRLDFLDKLEKRVKSRLNGKMIYLVGPREEKVIKEAIIKRFKFSLIGVEDDNIVIPAKRLIGFFEKSTVLDGILKR